MDNYNNDQEKRFNCCKLGKNIIASGLYLTEENNIDLCSSINSCGFCLNSSDLYSFGFDSSSLCSIGFNSSGLYSSGYCITGRLTTAQFMSSLVREHTCLLVDPTRNGLYSSDCSIIDSLTIVEVMSFGPREHTCLLVHPRRTRVLVTKPEVVGMSTKS